MPLQPIDADLVVVGAGAAGLMASIAAGRMSSGKRRILLLDSRPKVGAKILISGGTRCNVTNRSVSASDYHTGKPHFVRHVLEAFSSARTIRFFEEIGVPLVLEPSGKYFPATHSGRTVLEALMKESARVGVELVTGVKIVDVRRSVGAPGRSPLQFSLITESGETIHAKRIVLATGGLSLPETGSDGTGLGIARGLGHAIVPTAPALTPLLTEDRDWRELSGVALPAARLSYYEKGRKRAEVRGAFLFTHFGFSGPAPLDVSRHFALAEKGSDPFIEADFTPSGPEYPARFLKTFKAKQAGARHAVPLHCYRLPVTGVYGYKKAEVTAGGVDLSEMKQATMESRAAPGLHLCGEILDVDGRIGGFNFQWAWSTGWIAGSAAAKALA